MPLCGKAFSSAARVPLLLPATPSSLLSSPGRDGDFENSTQKGVLVPSMLCGGGCWFEMFARESQISSADSSICLFICLLIFWAALGASLGKNSR